jgi:hypothetical protein
MRYKPMYIGSSEVWYFAKDSGLDELIADGFGEQLYDFAVAIEQYVLEQYQEDYNVGETELDLLIQKAVEKE